VPQGVGVTWPLIPALASTYLRMIFQAPMRLKGFPSRLKKHLLLHGVLEKRLRCPCGYVFAASSRRFGERHQALFAAFAPNGQTAHLELDLAHPQGDHLADPKPPPYITSSMARSRWPRGVSTSGAAKRASTSSRLRKWGKASGGFGAAQAGAGVLAESAVSSRVLEQAPGGGQPPGPGARRRPLTCSCRPSQATRCIWVHLAPGIVHPLGSRMNSPARPGLRHRPPPYAGESPAPRAR
jgi:hypothetical protein